MNRKIYSGAISCLLTLLACNAAYAIEGDQKMDLDLCAASGDTLPLITWAGTVGGAVPTAIEVINGGGSLNWDSPTFDAGCALTSVVGANPSIGKCLPNGGPVGTTGQVTFTAPFGNSATTSATFTGGLMALTAESTFGLRVAEPGQGVCTRQFQLRINGTGGGWGDPHITTVDGVNYDFQSAGEFTALREPGLEIQTRQHPVSGGNGLHNDYTGLTTCVAVYSAVAAKFGSSKVTLQPNSGKNPEDPMELRVNEEVVTLTPRGIDLTVEGKSNGRIAQAGENIEMIDAHGTRLVVTPKFWPGPNIWYLAINVFDTTAREGTFGMIAPESWLPALPDGSSVGSKPEEDDDERYEQLYEKFADAWRVTDDTSLFYYNGKKTADFTLDEWPHNNPESCALQGQTPVQPTDQATAEAACAAIVNPDHKKDCIFDVQATGFAGFAESYAAMKDLKPAANGWGFNSGSGGSEQPPKDDIKDLLKKWWWLILLILLLLIILWRLLKKKSGP